jgi:hypothetical protein
LPFRVVIKEVQGDCAETVFNLGKEKPIKEKNK